MGEGVRGDVGGRTFEIVAGKRKFEIVTKKKGKESMHTDQIGWAVLYTRLRLMTDFMNGMNLYGCDFF